MSDAEIRDCKYCRAGRLTLVINLEGEDCDADSQADASKIGESTHVEKSYRFPKLMMVSVALWLLIGAAQALVAVGFIVNSAKSEEPLALAVYALVCAAQSALFLYPAVRIVMGKLKEPIYLSILSFVFGVGLLLSIDAGSNSSIIGKIFLATPLLLSGAFGIRSGAGYKQWKESRTSASGPVIQPHNPT